LHTKLNLYTYYADFRALAIGLEYAICDASNVSANSLDHVYQTVDYVNTCVDSINAVATNLLHVVTSF